MELRAQFGLQATPFTRELPVRHRFTHGQFDDVLQELRQVIEERMSAALIAPAGTGKTALVRALCDALPEARYRIHYVKVASLSKRDMCRAITAALAIPSAGSTPGLIRNIQAAVENAALADGLRTLLIFDDAHELRPDVLGLLKTLTNYAMDSQLLLSLLLIGQAPLAELLRRSELEDVARRLAHYATLRPLSRDETRAYVIHRCTVAGATTEPFDDGAHDAIFEIGRGNLRATDRLALKALHLAARKACDVVDHTMVIEARKALWP
ncbi:MAG: AAA family ATPase [Myxococcota bacterium]